MLSNALQTSHLAILYSELTFTLRLFVQALVMQEQQRLTYSMES